jgi:Cof subfamily protein (haloacid dehalogenase superfamily)
VIRLVLLDVDGTLVGARGVHESTWPAIGEAHAAGVRVALCTGRIGQGFARDLARRVGPDDLHVFQGGAVVSRPDGDAEYTRPIPPRAVAALVAHSRNVRVPLELYGERRFLVEFHDELTRVHERHLGVPAETADFDQLDLPVVRAQWVVPDRDWPRFRDVTLAVGGLEVNPATAPWSPGTVFSNVTREGTSKGSALRWLAARLGLGTNEVAMVGDGENDLEAMEAAGLAIAVGGAPERVKARAARVVAPPDGGGVAEALRAVIGG